MIGIVGVISIFKRQKMIKINREYVAKRLKSIQSRCSLKNSPLYCHYGGRGIKCQFTLDELYNWLIDKNINPKDLECHRINNDGDYTLDNIEFLGHIEHRHKHRGIRRTHPYRLSHPCTKEESDLLALLKIRIRRQ